MPGLRPMITKKQPGSGLTMVQRVGILGGTFDPVHIGHLRIAQEALEALALDRIVFIPAADPPHKPQREILPFHHRCHMISLSIAGNPCFFVSNIEQHMPGKSYSVLTLLDLHKLSRGREDYFFLLGLDSFLELDTWYRYRDLFSLAHLAVLQRPGYGESGPAGFLHRRVSVDYRWDETTRAFHHPSLRSVHMVDNTRLGISSTLIRKLAGRGKSIRYLVVDDVMRYIESQKIYRKGVTSTHDASEKFG